MLCQTCRKNVALVEATIGKGGIKICIPCALDIMDNDKDIVLEMKRGISVQEEKACMEEGNQD